MSKQLRSSALVAGVLSALVVGLWGGAAGAQDPCAGSKRLLRLGGRSTMFHGPVQSVADVQALFRDRRADIERLLPQVGFTGNAQDLFAAVAAGGSAIEETTLPRGTKMGWMFFRRRAQPSAMTDICWAAPESVPAYEVEFDSAGTRYRIAVPKICGNLALLGQTAAPAPPRQTAAPPPTCALSVTDSCDSLQFDINATGTTAQDVSIAIEGPERRQLAASEAASPLRWRYNNPTREAEFRFTLTGRTPAGAQCTDTETVRRDCCPETPPTITATASKTVVNVNEEVQVQADPRVSDCAQIRSVSIDGVEVGSPYTRNLSWAAPGTYTVVARVTDDEGQTAEASVVIEVRSPRYWTFRGWLSGVSFDDDVTHRIQGNQAFHYIWDSGWGLGLEAEYRFSDRLGLAGGLQWAEGDVLLKYDLPTSWEMDDDSWDFTSVFVGPMFHPMRTDRRVDLFIGPVIHYTNIGSLDFDLPSRDVNEDFDDEFSWGAQLGVDIALTKEGRAGLHVGTLWLDLSGDAESELGDVVVEDLYSVDINPLTFNLGFFYRFR